MSKKKKRLIIKEFKSEIISEGIKGLGVSDKRITTEINPKLISNEVSKTKHIAVKRKTDGKVYYVVVPENINANTRTALKPLPPQNSYKIKPKRIGAVSGTGGLLPEVSGGKKNG